MPPAGTFAFTAAEVEEAAARSRLAQVGAGDVATTRCGTPAVTVWWSDAGSGIDEDPALWCWGGPLGSSGWATDAELTDALEAARPALAGTWVIAGTTRAGTFRCRSSANHVHTLKSVGDAERSVWASRGLVAHALAGTRPHIDPERVAERILWDVIFGDDELITGTTLASDALHLDRDGSAWLRSTWWPLAERLFPTEPGGPAALADALREAFAPYDHLGRVGFGLTAGQDSSLLAAALHDGSAAQVPDCFTIGLEAFPDVIGARASAAALGWPHRTIGAGAGAPPTFERAVEASRWTEGLDHGRNAAGAPLRLFDAPSAWLAGLGGELGRAQFWADWPDGSDPVEVMLANRRPNLAPTLVARLEDRLRAAVAEGAEAGGDGLAVLDVVYLRSRMRSWLQRSVPQPDVTAILLPYLEPGPVRALLGLDPASRRTGDGFRAALRHLSIDPLAIATRAVASAHVPRRSPPSARLRRRTSTGPHPELDVVLALYAASPRRGDLVRDALGTRWFDATVASASAGSVGSTTQLWNGIAVEALSVALDELSW